MIVLESLKRIRKKEDQMIRKIKSGEYRLYSRKKGCQDRQASQPRNFQDSKCRRSPRESRAVLQTSLMRSALQTVATR